jgi:tRNA(adenine34) deaminase
MRLALNEAAQAAMLGEVPVGAAILLDGVLLAAAGNRRESLRDPTAHAEILALRQAARLAANLPDRAETNPSARGSSWRLCDATLYVTQEPCPMCAGALVNARIRRLVFGCLNPKAGSVRTLYRIVEDPRFNHRVEVCEGVLASECAVMLRSFFSAIRSAGAHQSEKNSPSNARR